MHREQFGILVATLRKEQFDQQMRRWTQQTLGEMTGLGPRIIAEIEQGRRHPDPEIVARLADAFQFSAGERHEFFVAASGLDGTAPASDAGSPQDALDVVLRVMQQSTLPAFIHDDYGDLIATNGAVENLTHLSRKLFETSDRFASGRFSTMRVIFDPDLGYEPLLGSHWPGIALQQMQFFRRISLKHRATPHLIAILEELNRLASFRTLWIEAGRARAVAGSSVVSYEHPHPPSGQLLRYIGVPAAHRTVWGILYLATFIPQDASTHQLFTRLYQQTPANTERYADWPKPLTE